MSFLSGGAGQNTFHPTSVYAPGTMATAQNLQPQINAANNEWGTAERGFGSLAGALQQQMAGQGPNLANAQLQSATAQNVANQAAMMAGQRGAGANAGLMARQIANQGANLQQQQAGQAAQNVLAQQLAAQGQLANVYGQQGQLANQNLGIQQNAMQAQNEGILKNQQGLNTIENANAQANANAKGSQMSGMLSGLASAGLGVMTGGLSGAATGALTSMAGKAEGGMITSMDKPMLQQPQQSMALQNFVNGIAPMSRPQMMAGGGSVLPFAPMNYTGGGSVQAQAPQQQAKVKGNSYSNDTIPAMLSQGEFVVNREIMQSPNAPELAAQAIRKALSRGKK